MLPLFVTLEWQEAPPPLPDTAPPLAQHDSTPVTLATPLTPPLRPAPSSPKRGDPEAKVRSSAQQWPHSVFFSCN